MSNTCRVVFMISLMAWVGACAEQPPPQAVPIYAEAQDMVLLEGDWWGHYWSVDTGRSGRIRLSLEADADRAFGDVLMLPSVRNDGGAAGDIDEPDPTPSETLSIEFVRIDSGTETVSGTLAPYRDPDCGCVVSTTFTGRVSRDAIEGTFVIQAGGAYGARRGKWKAERQAAEASE